MVAMRETSQNTGTWVWRKSSFSQPNNNNCVEVGHWRKSSFSQPNGNSCVEVAHFSELVGVRDSKNTDGPKLAFDRDHFLGFLGGIARR